jgi:ABC-type transport system substrate-binding protein
MAPARIASLAVLLALLCGSLQVTPTHGSAGAARQTYYGTLTLANSLAWWRLSPIGPFAYAVNNGDGQTDNYGGQPLVDSPLIVDDHGRYVADLATVVPTVANGGIRVVKGDEVVTVHLKPGQRWSDGSLITPADYIGAMLLSDAPTAPGLCLGPIKTVMATTTTLTVTFSGIYGPALDGCIPAPMPIEYFQRKYGVHLPADLLAAFNPADAATLYTSPSYQGSALQRLVQRWGQDPYNTVGDLYSGPYMPAQPITDRLEVLVPNPYYIALPPDPHHPRPAQLRWVMLAGDYLKALTAPGARIYDYALLPFPDDESANMQSLLARAGYRLVLSHFNKIEHLELNLATPALRDVRVRRALFYAIDREAYLRAIYPQLTAAQRDATLLAAPWPLTSSWSINGQLPRNPYDPAKARALLAAAGYASSPGAPGRHLRLDFVTSGSPLRVTSGRTLQRLLAPFGITLRLHFVPQNAPIGLFAPYDQGGILAHGRFDIAEFQYLSDVEPGSGLMGNLDPGQIPDANHPNGGNYTGVRDVQLLQLMTHATRTLDDKARYQLYAQAQRLIIDNAYWIPLFSPPGFTALRPTFGNYSRGGDEYADSWNTFEWYRNDKH